MSLAGCRGFTGILAVPARQGQWIEQKQKVDVRRVIEFVAAELSHRDDRKTLRLGLGQSLGDRCADGLIDRYLKNPGRLV